MKGNKTLTCLCQEACKIFQEIPKPMCFMKLLNRVESYLTYLFYQKRLQDVLSCSSFSKVKNQKSYWIFPNNP